MDLLRVTLNELEGKCKLSLQFVSGLELLFRIVDGCNMGTKPCQPGGNIGCSTSQFNYVLAHDLRKEAQLAFGNVPDAPFGLLLLPRFPAGFYELWGPPVPATRFLET